MGLSNTFKNFLIFLKCFTRYEKMGLFLLIVGGIFAAILEFLAAWSIFPLLRVIYQPHIVTSHPFLKGIYNYLGWENPKYVIAIVVFIILGIMIIKSIFCVFYLHFEANYLTKIRANLQKLFFTHYITSSYEDYLALSSSSMIGMFTSTVGYVINNLFHQYLTLFNQLLTAIALMYALFYFYEDLAIWVLGIGLFLLYSHTSFIKKKMYKIGKKIQGLESQQQETLSQSFKGFKDTKIHQKEFYFAEKYQQINLNLSKQQQTLNFFQNLPGTTIELVGLTIIYICLILLIIKTDQLGEIFTNFGIFAFLALRALPIVNRSIQCLAMINSSAYPLQELLNESERLGFLNTKEGKNKFLQHDEEERLSFKNVIEFKNISYRYPRAHKDALKEISLKIKKGSFVGITGKSGAGKTTLIGILLGFLRPKEGEIILDNKNIIFENLPLLYNLVGYVDQQTFLLNSTIAQNVAYGVEEDKIDYDKVEKALRRALLWDHVKTLEKGVHTNIGEDGINLSGGQRQRLAIARALYKQIEILILDEASATLDVETEKAFFDTLYSLKGELTVIMIAHRLSTLRECDMILVIDNGFIESYDTLDKIHETSSIFKRLADYSQINLSKNPS